MIDSARRTSAACADELSTRSGPDRVDSLDAAGRAGSQTPDSELDSSNFVTSDVARGQTSVEFTEQTSAEQAQLAARIRTRIHDRLPGRIRKLSIYIDLDTIVLAGQCSTYHSKQMAQQVAMGVLEYQRIVNNIDVRTVR